MKFPRLPTKTLLGIVHRPSSCPTRKPGNPPDATKSPRLPWEVLERIISECSANVLSLPESILPRARRRGVFPFVAFLEANPDLKPLVLSIVVRPTDFVPSPLYLLPHLSAIECVSSGPNKASFLPLHRTGLACFRRPGTHVQTLHLVNVSFPTSLAYVQVLLALESVTHLVCTDVIINTGGEKGPLDVVKRHLSERLRLLSLAIDSQSLTGGERDGSVGAVTHGDDAERDCEEGGDEEEEADGDESSDEEDEGDENPDDDDDADDADDDDEYGAHGYAPP